jgi:hypothetical protein
MTWSTKPRCVKPVKEIGQSWPGDIPAVENWRSRQTPCQPQRVSPGKETDLHTLVSPCFLFLQACKPIWTPPPPWATTNWRIITTSTKIDIRPALLLPHSGCLRFYQMEYQPSFLAKLCVPYQPAPSQYLPCQASYHIILPPARRPSSVLSLPHLIGQMWLS